MTEADRQKIFRFRRAIAATLITAITAMAVTSVVEVFVFGRWMSIVFVGLVVAVAHAPISSLLDPERVGLLATTRRLRLVHPRRPRFDDDDLGDERNQR